VQDKKEAEKNAAIGPAGVGALKVGAGGGAQLR